MMIQNLIIGIAFATITIYIILNNYKKIAIYKCNKLTLIILLLVLTFINIASKSIWGYFSIITGILTGVLTPISLSLLVCIIFGKNRTKV